MEAYLLATFFLESIQFYASLIGSRPGVKPPQVRGHCLAVLLGAEVQRVARKVDDTGLHYGFREGCGDGVGEAFEAIHDRDQDVLHPTVLQFHHHGQPELGALVIGNPQAQVECPHRVVQFEC
jgi:hypothetical protein